MAPMGMRSRYKGVASKVRRTFLCSPRVLACGWNEDVLEIIRIGLYESLGGQESLGLLIGVSRSSGLRLATVGVIQKGRREPESTLALRGPSMEASVASQSLGRLGNHIQHGLHIRWRASDPTPRISLVAVCCSNDSLSSWNNRTFSMAITAWSAKVSSSLICGGVKGRTSVRRAASNPISSPC